MVTNTVFSKYNNVVYVSTKERTALEHKKSLAFLPVGEKARVLSVENGGNMKRRLQDLGVIRGTEIGCVLDSISGDIKVYLIRGAYIAIRKSDAEQILLE